MKRLLLLPLLALLASCTTTGQPDIARISRAVQEAARFGTEEALRFKPEWRPQFEVVRDQLNSLLAADKLTVAELLNAIDRLPVSELSSDTGRLIIGAARLTVSIAGWSDVEIVQTAQAKPVGVALVSGITAGLGVPVNRPQPTHTPKYFKPK